MSYDMTIIHSFQGAWCGRVFVSADGRLLRTEIRYWNDDGTVGR